MPFERGERAWSEWPGYCATDWVRECKHARFKSVSRPPFDGARACDLHVSCSFVFDRRCERTSQTEIESSRVGRHGKGLNRQTLRWVCACPTWIELKVVCTEAVRAMEFFGIILVIVRHCNRINGQSCFRWRVSFAGYHHHINCRGKGKQFPCRVRLILW